ncbi:MAG TPA: glycine zipper 2TM domain-containing protein [Albitalea sp.]
MKTLRHLLGVMAMLGCVAASAEARPPEDPRVDRFDVEEVDRLDPGTPLHFSLYGTPGATATLRIEGADDTLALQEQHAGVYEGTHVIAPHERITPHSRVSAELRLGERVALALLEEPLVLGTAVAARCADCGVVQSVRAVDAGGSPGMAGAVAGGVLGAVIGRQIGEGDGRTLAGILGAIGGAYAGREIERSQHRRTRHEVRVQLDDGRVHTRRFEGAPPFRVGDRIRIVQGRWLHDTHADPR